MSDKRLFILGGHPEARKRAAQAVAEAPEGWVVRIEPPKRNGEQNAALHATIADIARRSEWCGKKLDVDTWKRLLVGAWSRARGEPVSMFPALDGNGVEIVFRRTSSLTKVECSELLDWIGAWAAEHVPEVA